MRALHADRECGLCGRDHGTKRHLLGAAARSTDGGVTWSAPSALDPNAGVDAGDDIAPQLATDGWGTWVAVWESADALGGDNDILAAVLDPSVYQDTDSSGSFDPVEERPGGVGETEVRSSNTRST